MAPRRFERDASRSRFERLERRLVVALAFGKERDRATVRKNLPGARERFVVGAAPCGVVHSRLILLASHGNHPREREKRPEERNLPQRVLAQKPRIHGERPQDQHGVDETVHVVRNQQKRLVARDPLGSRDLEAAKEDPEKSAGERRDPIGARRHASCSFEPRAAFQATTSARPRASSIHLMPIRPRRKKAEVERIAIRCEVRYEMIPNKNGPTM